jgi:hypothetical protein
MSKASNKPGSIPFLLRLPPDLYDAVRSLAERETRSINGEIVHLLRQRLDPAAGDPAFPPMHRPYPPQAAPPAHLSPPPQ